jgi:hypothetical protein
LYVGKSYQPLLLASAKPELTWLHSASVGSLIELLVITGFGVNRTPNISSLSIISRDEIAHREDEVGNIITVLMKRSCEMVYVVSGLCGLIPLVSAEWWKKNPFVYLDVWSYMRSMMLQQETHKWCALLPSFTTALSALLKVDAPIRKPSPGRVPATTQADRCRPNSPLFPLELNPHRPPAKIPPLARAPTLMSHLPRPPHRPHRNTPEIASKAAHSVAG